MIVKTNGMEAMKMIQMRMLNAAESLRVCESVSVTAFCRTAEGFRPRDPMLSLHIEP